MQKTVLLAKTALFFARIAQQHFACMQSLMCWFWPIFLIFLTTMRRFFLIFLGLQLGLFGLNMLNWVQQHVVLPWTSTLASVCAGLVMWFDGSTAAAGKVLWNTSNGFGVSIEAGCNGLEAYIVLFAGVMAFPASWYQRGVGLLMGFLAVQSLNVVRVISLFYLGQWSRPVFDFAHEYLWQALIMLDVLVFWLLWVRWCQKGPAVHDERQGGVHA